MFGSQKEREEKRSSHDDRFDEVANTTKYASMANKLSKGDFGNSTIRGTFAITNEIVLFR